MKIAFVASEAVPFAKTGDMADVCGALPTALAELGEEVILVLPKYQVIRLAGVPLKKMDQDFDVGLLAENVRVYLVKHDMYLREDLYGDRFGDYPDNLKRFSYFCRKVFDLFPRIGFSPDVIHCHDWQTSLVPVYLRASADRLFPEKRKPKSLLTIHNMSYQGIFPKEEMPAMELGWEFFTPAGLEYYDRINLLKGGILFADEVNTVSLGYAREVQAPAFGCGLEGVLADRREHFCGILNGVDYRVWNPQGDPYIFKNYAFQHIADKKTNKARLQEMCRLSVHDDAFMIGFVGRLVAQKGTDLMLKVLPEVCESGAQLVALGTGDPQAEAAFASLSERYPSQVFVSSHFDDILAHRIYAGTDVFLIPSQFEPCGIGQMISFKYGTVPVVFKTGGLADTVVDATAYPAQGNGFVFTSYDGAGLRDALQRARERFAEKKKWQELIKRIMRLNFSWKESAKKYLELYKQAP